MRRSRATRLREASLNGWLVMLAWWVGTRSLAAHAVITGMIIIFTAQLKVEPAARTYASILYGPPVWVWGMAVIACASLWTISRGWICVVSGILAGLWFWGFAIAFGWAYISTGQPGTTPTGWATYTFVGWWWMCISYVVWRDTKHVKEETATKELAA